MEMYIIRNFIPYQNKAIFPIHGEEKYLKQEQIKAEISFDKSPIIRKFVHDH